VDVNYPAAAERIAFAPGTSMFMAPVMTEQVTSQMEGIIDWKAWQNTLKDINNYCFRRVIIAGTLIIIKSFRLIRINLRDCVI